MDKGKLKMNIKYSQCGIVVRFFNLILMWFLIINPYNLANLCRGEKLSLFYEFT